MATLKTDYKDDRLNVIENTDREYTLKDKDGKVIEEKVTITETSKYDVVGDTFGADDINATNTQVNQNTADIEELKEGGGGAGSGIVSVEYEEWKDYPEEKKNKGAYAVKHYPTGLSVGEVNDRLNGVADKVDELNDRMGEVEEMIISEEIIIDNISIAKSSVYSSDGIDISKDGYIPLMVSCSIRNASQSGASSATCFVYRQMIINEDKLSIGVRNYDAGTNAKVMIVANILYKKIF